MASERMVRVNVARRKKRADASTGDPPERSSGDRGMGGGLLRAPIPGRSSSERITPGMPGALRALTLQTRPEPADLAAMADFVFEDMKPRPVGIHVRRRAKRCLEP